MQNRSGTESRRSFLGRSALAGAGASTFLIVKPEQVRGVGPERLKVGLVGCGGRGSQGAVDLLTGNPNAELVAMGDLFEDKLERSFFIMQRDKRYPKVKDRIKVPPDRHFTGFDAYKKVIATDVDIVMLCTPPVYRPLHFEAAVQARKHVFAEKPIATDAVGVRRFLAAARQAQQLKLTVMSGAQGRSTPARIQAVERIRKGDIGEILATYAFYIVDNPIIKEKSRKPNWADMEWQHRNWYSFVWINGDPFVEQHFHNIDFVNWVMGTHPASVVASGGCAWRPREAPYGNTYDHLTAEFIYPNGVHLSSHWRQYPPGTLHRKIVELIVGTKGKSEHVELGGPGQDPKELEHISMVKSILGEGPYVNHGIEVAESTLTCIMGREAAYSGLELTWDQIMASQQDFLPKAFGYDLKMDVPEVAVPGKYKFI